jgi:hypothetical protein
VKTCALKDWAGCFQISLIADVKCQQVIFWLAPQFYYSMHTSLKNRKVKEQQPEKRGFKRLAKKTRRQKSNVKRLKKTNQNIQKLNAKNSKSV